MDQQEKLERRKIFMERINKHSAIRSGHREIVNEFKRNLTPTRKDANTSVELRAASIQQIHEYLKKLTSYIIEIRQGLAPEMINSTVMELEVDLSNLYVTEPLALENLSPVILDYRFTFLNSVFTGGLYCRNVTFNNPYSPCSFDNIGGNIDCSNALFNSAGLSCINTERTNLIGKFNFQGAKFKSANFSNSKFNDIVDFDAAIFEGETNFSNCSFAISPSFHKAILHQKTSFRNAIFNSTKSESDLLAYRTLQGEMKKINNRFDENLFFAYEQRTLRNLDSQDMRKNWFTVTVSYLYDAISGYGQNILRPLGLLFSIWLVFGLIFSFPHFVLITPPDEKTINIIVNASSSANISTAPLPNKIASSVWFSGLSKDGVEWTNPGTGLMYSFQNIFNPASLFGKDNLFTAGNIVILILAYIEFLMAIAFITLWLLAVRRRFQKGE